MKEKKLAGKIITTILTVLLIVCFFTPLLNFSSYINTYSDITGSVEMNATLAKYVTPMQVIAAQFASEDDLEKAKNEYYALVASIESIDGLTSAAQEDRIAASDEAAKYFTILFSQEKDLIEGLTLIPIGEDHENMVSAMKLYTYFSFALLALIISLVVLLILRCIYPKNKGFMVSGNILSISVFAFSVIALFITIPMVLESHLNILDAQMSVTITPNPNFLFNGILIAMSLLVMILTLTTKGLKKNKK